MNWRLALGLVERLVLPPVDVVAGQQHRFGILQPHSMPVFMACQSRCASVVTKEHLATIVRLFMRRSDGWEAHGFPAFTTWMDSNESK
jgi:hypothetical protein